MLVRCSRPLSQGYVGIEVPPLNSSETDRISDLRNTGSGWGFSDGAAPVEESPKTDQLVSSRVGDWVQVGNRALQRAMTWDVVSFRRNRVRENG